TYGTAVITTASDSVDITELDAAVSFSIAANQTSISEDLEESVDFTVSRTGGTLAAGNEATVTIAGSGSASDGTDYDPDLSQALTDAAAATPGVSFNSTTGVLTFTGDATSLTYTLTATDDSDVEGTETVVATLSDPAVTYGTAVITTASDSVDITENDVVLTAKASTVTVKENALDFIQDPEDLAPGTVEGSLPSSPDETAGSTLVANGGTGPYSFSLVGNSTGDHGTIQINTDGTYRYTLTAPVSTTPYANDGVTTELSDTFNYQVTDAFGITATNTITIYAIDDVPATLAPDSAHIEDLATNPDIIEQLNFFPGADGSDAVEFNVDDQIGVDATDAQGNLLTFEGQQLRLYYGNDGADKTLLEAKTDDGDVGFTIDIDSTTGTYSVHSNGIISNGTASTTTDLTGVGGGNIVWKAIIDIGGSTEDVIMSTKTGATVNTNNSEIGISGGNSFSEGEGIRYDFINNLEVWRTGGDWHFDYDGTHNETKAWRQEVSKVVGTAANITITAIDADGDDLFYNDSDEDKVALSASDIKIYDTNDKLIEDWNAAGITVDDQNLYSVTINGLLEGYSYEVQTENSFTALQVDAASGTDEFKFGFFSYGEETLGTPIDLSYDIIGFDGDGDSIDSTIDVSFYPDGNTWTGTDFSDTYEGDAGDNVILGDGGVDTLFGLGGNDVIDGNSGDDIMLSGGDGHDFIYGGSGNDLLDGGLDNDLLDAGSGNDELYGGLGNDILVGGDGEDAFFFSANAGEGLDTISDFNVSEDTLSFADLLDGGVTGLEDELAGLTASIGVAIIDGDLVLTIPDQYDGNPDTVVTLAGLGNDYASYNGQTLADIIGDTLNLGVDQINVDGYAS
ncbi:MAG: Calx-beta domain-containing protein, partial [Desulfuromonadales bacterium]|nr:Calx-beta domain-containing protein [Desulfuromonadales bacterium]